MTQAASSGFAHCLRGLLRLAAKTYLALPIPHRLRYLINLALLGRFYFLTRHVLRALAPTPRDALARALARLREAKHQGVSTSHNFAAQESPDISIIIPVFNQALYTALCLQSITESHSRRSFEILIIDDASTDTTPVMLQGYGNVRVLRNATNVGFIRSCNRGAREARGHLLLFLNNDTWVVPGWLDALADTFDGFEKVGLVGSKLVSPDGLLQEAGGIIWKDATGWNYGHNQDPNRPEFNYLRDVDYCSGASLMVPRALFGRLGGFDERYVPAYYEDADLAFSVRAAGLRVLYQPMSEVIHFEGVTSGRDIRQGAKAYQAVNLGKFLEKWSHALACHRRPGESPRLEKERRVQRRALVIDVRTPMPDKDSGSLDALNYILALQSLGFKVTFIPENLFNAGRYTTQLQKIGVECLYASYVPSVTAHLRERGIDYDLVLLSRVYTAARHIDNVRRYCPNARVLFNVVDLHFLREQRQAAVEGSGALAREAERTKRKELRTMRLADATIVLSGVEHEILRREVPDVSIFTIPLLREIPGRTAPFGARRDVAFIGGYEHLPNVDAVQYFVSEIWPLVRQRLPEAVFLVLGSNPPPKLLALKEEGVIVAGYVEDLSPYFNRCRVSVAPLRYGAGVKGKVGTSLSFGVPSVATSIAVEGMGLTDGKDVLVADDPQGFADAVVRLYTDETLWSDLSDNGLEFVERNYSLAAGRERLRSMLADIDALRPPGADATIQRRPRKTGSRAHLTVCRVDSFAEYSTRQGIMLNEQTRREALEAGLVPGRRPFTVGGYCYICEKRSRFLVDFMFSPKDARVPNWRERLVCWRCRLNNRTRAAIHIFEQLIRPGLEDEIYVTEQCSPLYKWLRKRYPNVTGSEYLGDSIATGSSNQQGVRNESVINLSFPDASFNHILSFDVFEHVPDYRVALVECLRCLKPGGKLLFSVPFRRDLAANLERARVLENGEIEHLLPAEYHGDPINPSGCLCFWHFGWGLLDEMRGVGFRRASACLYWSAELGYLGGEQIAFVGFKA